MAELTAVTCQSVCCLPVFPWEMANSQMPLPLTLFILSIGLGPTPGVRRWKLFFTCSRPLVIPQARCFYSCSKKTLSVSPSLHLPPCIFL